MECRLGVVAAVGVCGLLLTDERTALHAIVRSPRWPSVAVWTYLLVAGTEPSALSHKGRRAGSRWHDMRENAYIALVGFPARDTKHMLDGRVEGSLGGVLFSALALAALARPLGLDVIPICRIGRDIADATLALLAAGGCRLDGVRVVDGTTQHSIITFTGPNERWERVEGSLPSLGPGDLAPWRSARLFAVNFITGNELDLATFRWLREEYDGPIVVDYHTLALATLPDGRRVPRRRDDWAAWIERATVVQMNEQEAGALAGRPLTDMAGWRAFACQLLLLGPAAAIITRGDRGAIGVERPRGNGRRFASYHVPAELPPKIVDTVGCGDVFLAALAAGWARWGTLEPALRLATRAAGLHAGYLGLKGISGLTSAWPAETAMG